MTSSRIVLCGDIDSCETEMSCGADWLARVLIELLVPVAALGRYRPCQAFWQRLNQTVFFRTLKIGVLVTSAAAVIGYASAYSIVDLGPSGKGRMVV